MWFGQKGLGFTLKYSKLFLILTVIGCLEIQNTNAFISTVSTAIDIAQYGYRGIKSIIGMKKTYDAKIWKQRVTESLSEIINSTKRIETLIVEEADRVIKELSVKFDMRIVHDFMRLVHTINQRYEKKFVKYFLEDDNDYQLETIEKFVNDTISEFGFKKELRKINEYIIPRHYFSHVEDKRMFDVLFDYHQIKMNHHRDCNEGSSHHQQLFGVYNIAILTLVRGYWMVVYAYKYRQRQGFNIRNYHEAWEPEILDTVDEFKDNLLLIAQLARNTMDKSSKEIRRCDPSKYIQDSSYIRLKQFLSTFLTTQTSMSKSFSCSGKCSDYKRLGPIIPSNQVTARYPQFSCSGTAYDCWKTSVSQICLDTSENERRFEALTENYGLFDGFKHHRRGIWSDRCSVHKVSSTDIITADPLCNICACTCDEWRSAGSLRAFSLREQYTDIDNGRVVTGVRFKVNDNVIHLEIQEGKLLNGSIDPDTVRWNPNASYLPQVGSEVVHLNYNMRSVNLDDIVLPTGFVVTGVKFALISGRLSLMVAGLKIYDESGLSIDLSGQKMQWYYPNYSSSRTELKLEKADVPTRDYNKVNVELSKSGQDFINFQLTNWDKDASQTVVPYIDSQEVVSSPSTPCGGIGLFYKNYEESGGFIALKLLAANYSIHISDENLNKIFQE